VNGSRPEAEMRQAVLLAPRRLEVQSKPLAEPGRGEVRVRVAYCGVCGSDRHIYEGLEPELTYPVVPGHELTGVVEAVGPEVGSVDVDNPVAVFPLVACGRCRMCEKGFINLCSDARFVGAHGIPGGFATHAVIPSCSVVPIEGSRLQQGVFTEPLAVAVHAADAAAVQGKRVLIVGCGTMGLLMVQMMKLRGAKEIWCVDRSHLRVVLAERLGADTGVALVPEEEEATSQRLQEWAPEVVFECVGAEASLNLALQSAEPRATVVLLGEHVVTPRARVILVENRELILRGICIYPRSAFQEALRLVEQETVLVDPLISRTIGLEDLPRVLGGHTEEEHPGVKIVVKPNSESERCWRKGDEETSGEVSPAGPQE